MPVAKRIYASLPVFLILVFLVGFTFSVSNGLDAYLLFFIPVALALTVIVAVSLHGWYKYWLLLPLMIPVTVRLESIGGGVGLSVPFEPAMLLFLLFALYYLMIAGLQVRYIVHSLTLMIFFSFCWSVITAVTANDTMVSVKWLISKSIYLTVFFLFPLAAFRHEKRFASFFKYYILGLVPVILIAMADHAKWGFSKDYSPYMPLPFFKDHTIYGNSILFVLPVFIFCGPYFFPFKKAKRNKFLYGSILLVLLAGLLFSYSRASWLGAIAAFLCWIGLRYKLRPYHFLLLIIVVVVSISMNFEKVYSSMRSRFQGKYRSFSEHFESMGNLRNNESNLERVNRWSCAWRMFLDKPVTGFGPANYEKSYGTFQQHQEMTRISTFSGDKGDAHSELLTALSEQGLAGGLYWLLQVFLMAWLGIVTYYRLNPGFAKNLTLGILLGLIAFFTHSFVNDFIESDEFAPLFWLSAAALVFLHTKSLERRSVPSVF